MREGQKIAGTGCMHDEGGHGDGAVSEIGETTTARVHGESPRGIVAAI